jgi:ribonuclease P protein component
VAKQFTLGKKERLKSRKAIEHLFSSGQRFNLLPYRVFYSFQNTTKTDQPLQAGFSASSRIFKTAVHRNRIKRLTKEAWRLQKNELQTMLKEQNKSLHVFFIYTGKELPVYDQVSASMKLILKKLVGLSDKTN